MMIVLLMLFACAAGSVATYFIFDAPRRRAQARVEKIFRETEQRRDEILYDTQLRQDELLRKWGDLTVENPLIKTELRNLILQLAHRTAGHREVETRIAAVCQQRDELGRLLLKEVHALTRKALTVNNYVEMNQRLVGAFAQVTHLGVAVPSSEQDRMKASLRLQYDKALRAADERERQAELRERMREDERLEREKRAAIEEAKRAEREKQLIQEALDRALQDASGQHAVEIEQLQAQLAAAEATIADSQRTISMAEQTRVGHVYVISNVGSFGKDVFKIGMTRRLEPQIRVDELGSASVPFPFDVHMMIGTQDAPDLERKLHKAFHKRRVNRSNFRKEFFRVTINEIAETVETLHGKIEYQADAEAIEYMASGKVTDRELDDLESTAAALENILEDLPEMEEG
jgi:hypothetical protein